MGVDINRLAPWAQKQILDKYRAEMARIGNHDAQDEEKKRSKYHSTPDERGGAEGVKIRFDSKAEARRYDELMLLYKAGRITDLKLQPEWTLQEAYTTPEGNRVRAIRYRADFSYLNGNNELVVEDVKSKATKTRVYSIKKKLLLEKHGIKITEIE